MQRIHFHKIHDIKNKLLIIIHVDKNECSKRDKFFLIQNLELLLKPFALKPTKAKGHIIMYLQHKNKLFFF